MTLSGLERQRLGGHRSGKHAVKHKKGIHGLSSEQRKSHSRKGNESFLTKWRSEAYQELHRNKIRFGKIVSRFRRIKKPSRDDFGFSR